MIGAERRLTRRAQWINDIILEPNNGGIVLNVSEGGLCFHSIDSVQQESPIRFSLSLHNQQIEAAGEVAWLDATGRTGGLRFTTLPAEIHEEIRRWVNQPAESVATNGFPTALPIRALISSPWCWRWDQGDGSFHASGLTRTHSTGTIEEFFRWFSGRTFHLGSRDRRAPVS